MTDEQTAELIALVNAHGSPAAVRALADLLNEHAELKRVTAFYREFSDIAIRQRDEAREEIDTWVLRIRRAETIYGEPLDPPLDDVRDVRAHLGYRKVTFTRADGSTVAYAREHADAGRATWRPS